MFEQSMVVSPVGRVSAEMRWTWVGSVAMQGCAALLLVILPLLRPERMVFSGSAPKAYVPLRVVKAEPVRVKATESRVSTSHAELAAVSAARSLRAPGSIPHGIGVGDPPPMIGTGGFSEMQTGLPAELASSGTGVHVAVATAAPMRGPLRISSGVGAGMLLGAIRPVYPEIAKAARVEGVVVVEATISKEGRIESARVVSGPAMLAGAALDAVKMARYAPYRLNGAAVEVETSITVNFRIGS